MAKRTTRSSKNKPTKQPTDDKFESNKYDKIIKEGYRITHEAILRRILRIQYHRIEFPPITKQQTTKEVEPDFIGVFFNDDYPLGAVFHVEVESGVDLELPDRVLEKVAMERRIFKLPVFAFCIYIGEGQPHIPNEVRQDGLYYVFPVFYLSLEPFTDFIASEYPDEVALAILANFQGKDPTEVIRTIIQRLQELRGDSKELQKFLNQLRMLSKLRNLLPEIHTIIKEMVLDYNIENDVLFITGHEKGIEIGVEKGIEKEIEIASFNMLDKGFDTKLIAEILDIPHGQILKIKKLWQIDQQIKALVKSGVKKQADLAAKLNISVEIVCQLLNRKSKRAG